MAISAILIVWLLLPLPSPLFNTPFTTTVESVDGELLGATIATDGQWRFPTSDSIPEHFRHCILEFEDAYFDYHFGVNPVSLWKALQTNFKAGKVRRGGSTISMQVIRLSMNNPPRTLGQKLLETLLAIKLEILYSKEEILNLYVSHAPFGGNVVGLQAASWRYYQRPPHLLSWAEAAALAVLPNSPSLVYPGKNEIHFKRKRDFLLDKLHQQGYFDSLSCELSKAEELPGTPFNMPQATPRLLTRLVNEGHGGQQNVVTIDPTLQRQVKSKVESHSKVLQHNHIYNAAALVIELESGEVKSYVGNVNSGLDHSQDVDVITAQRSTGSLLKPFLYALAIDDAIITPKSLLKDYPVFLQGFAPQNFDLDYRGAVHADEALTRSLNLPFVMLLKDYGIEKFHQKLRATGMKSLTQSPDHYGLSLILGGAETSLWEMAQMYGNLFRLYHQSMSRPITQLYDTMDFQSHYFLEKDQNNRNITAEDQVMSVGAAWSSLEALKGLHRPEGFSGWERFRSSVPVSWKTGTSFGFRDAWSIGINGKYLVGVWTGNADGEGRAGLVGGVTSAPLMFQIFELLDHTPYGEVPTAETVEVEYCKTTGELACDYCMDKELVSWPKATGGTQSCTYYKMLHLDQSERYQVNSSCYSVSEMKHRPWFVLPPVQAWYYQRKNIDYKSPPPFMEGCEVDQKQNSIQLIYPRAATKIYIPKELGGEKGQAVFEAAHTYKNKPLYWHVDDEYLGETIGTHQMAIQVETGGHLLSITNEFGEEVFSQFEVLSD